MRDRRDEFNRDTWREDFDWKEAFVYAKDIRIATDTSNAPFTMDDVADVIAAENGENDGPSWVMVGKLKDGRFFFLDAGCDYTGWDCQAGGDAAVAGSLADLVRWGMGKDQRARLKMESPA